MYRAIAIASLPGTLRPEGVILGAEQAALAAEAAELHRRHARGLDKQARHLHVVHRWKQVSRCPYRPLRLLLTLRLSNGSKYRAAWLWRGSEARGDGYWQRVPYTEARPQTGRLRFA